MHFRQHQRKQFAGRVLDGPYEGDWVEEDVSYFEAYHKRPLVGVYAYDDELASATFEVDRVFYKWLHGYGAWAWIQPKTKAQRKGA